MWIGSRTGAVFCAGAMLAITSEKTAQAGEDLPFVGFQESSQGLERPIFLSLGAGTPGHATARHVLFGSQGDFNRSHRGTSPLIECL